TELGEVAAPRSRRSPAADWSPRRTSAPLLTAVSRSPRQVASCLDLQALRRYTEHRCRRLTRTADIFERWRARVAAVVISPDRFDGVIFDMDGVVTDTASVHAAAWRR